jgi:hypothetical protein
MDATALAVGDADASALNESDYRPSKLARSLSIGPKKRSKADISRCAKRAAVVLRRGMRQADFRRIEMRLDRNELASLPIIVGPGGRAGLVPDTPLCGLIITGSDGVVHADERRSLEDIVRNAADRDVPILAMSDAAPLALAAAGREPIEGNPGAVLIGRSVSVLSSRSDIDKAIDRMAAAPTR